MKNEMELVQSKELRMDLIENLDVLDKVKGLILFPKTQIVTTQQLSEYFEVALGTLDWTIKENKDELLSNGLVVLEGVDLKRFKTDLGNPSELKRVAKLNIFNKRAVLNVAMLLRDSPIAQKIRQVLLETIDKEEVTQIAVQAIDEEKALMLGVLMATDDETHLLALKRWKDYKDAKFNVISMERKIAVEKVENLTKSEATFGLREAVANLGIKEKVLKEYLISNGYMYRQMKRDDVKGSPTGRLKAHSEFTKEPKRFFTDIKVLDHKEVAHTQTVFTIDGIEHFRKLKEEIIK
jgi:hypothetical protein